MKRELMQEMARVHVLIGVVDAALHYRETCDDSELMDALTSYDIYLGEECVCDGNCECDCSDDEGDDDATM